MVVNNKSHTSKPSVKTNRTETGKNNSLKSEVASKSVSSNTQVHKKHHLNSSSRVHQSPASVETPYDDLYVCMLDAAGKRKDLLEGIKLSLVMQQESERIAEMRKEKAEILNDVKKGLAKLNQDYQDLRKLMPNVKNVISLTEQELIELDSQIEMLKTDINYDKENIELDRSLENSIYEANDLNQYDEEFIPADKPKPKLKPKVVEKKHEPIEPKYRERIINVKSVDGMSKLDRIKNNLKVIEGKLRNLD